MDADDRRIVIDCPECRRTIWASAVCTHGTVPPPADPPAEPVGGPDVDPPKTRKKRSDLRGGV